MALSELMESPLLAAARSGPPGLCAAPRVQPQQPQQVQRPDGRARGRRKSASPQCNRGSRSGTAPWGRGSHGMAVRNGVHVNTLPPRGQRPGEGAQCTPNVGEIVQAH